VRMSWAISP